METEVRWVASFSASCFYAAKAVAQGSAPAGCKLTATVAEPAEALHREVDSFGLPVERFWRHMVPLAAQIENNRQLAEVVLAKTIGMAGRAQLEVEPLERRIAEVEAAVLREHAGLLDTLAEDSEPLRREWDLWGSAILDRVARSTDERVLVSSADAVLVSPVFGGGGTANLDYNSACIESVPEGRAKELPEAVRLAWLIAQLNVDLPMFSEEIHRDRLPLVAAAAMLPPVLVAAEELELAKFDRAAISAALAQSRLGLPQTTDPVDSIMSWWETYSDSRPSWTVALAALDRMLG